MGQWQQRQENAPGMRMERNGQLRDAIGADRGNLGYIIIQKQVTIPSYLDKSSMPYLQCFTGENHEILKFPFL